MVGNKSRVGIVPLSAEVLRQALLLPEGTDIVDVRMANDRHGVVELKLAHPDLPEVEAGNVIPSYRPRFVTEDGVGKFQDWGDR